MRMLLCECSRLLYISATCVMVQGGCRKVVDGLTGNTTVLYLDLRGTGCSPELMHCAETLLVRNRQQANVDVGCDQSPSQQPPC